MRNILILTFCILNAAVAQAGPDQCRDVLVYAARNQSQSLSKSSMNSDIKRALCDQNDFSNSSNNRLGAGLTIFGWGAGSVKKSNEALQTAKNKYCETNSSELSNDDFDSVVSNIVDQGAVSAWQNCMKGGLVGSIERNEDDVLLHLRWVAVVNQDSTTITGMAISGISCPSLWPVGMTIRSADNIKLCSGNSGKSITVTINSANGDLALIAPPAIKKPIAVEPPKSKRDKCLEGTVSECHALAAQILQECDKKFPGRGIGNMMLAGSWRACQQEGTFLEDLGAAAEGVKTSCASDVDSLACREAQQRHDQVKSIAFTPFVPPPASGPPAGTPIFAPGQPPQPRPNR